MSQAFKRILQAIFTIWASVTISFALIRQIPGGPTSYLVAQYASSGRDPGNVNQLAERYFNQRFDDPLWKQYIDYVTGLAQGDMGTSLFLREPIFELLINALPWTLLVMSIAIVFSYVIGILLGAALAYREGTRFDSTGSVTSIILTSVPYYVVALLFLFYFGYNREWFPTSGRYSSELDPTLSLTFFLDALHHAFLPAISVILTAAGGVALSMRANSISVLGADFLRVARLRGLSPNRIVSRYLVWNAVLPMWTGLMISIGFMFGGSVVLERIFQYQGIGYYMFRGIVSRDYPLMMGAFIIIVITVNIAIVLADITYRFIDPRAGSTGETNANISVRRTIAGIKLKIYRVFKSKPTGINSEKLTNGSGTTNADSPINFGSPGQKDANMSRTDRTATVLRRVWASLRAVLVILWNDWRSRVGISILLFYFILAVFGPMVVPEPSVGQGPYQIGVFENWNHPLGTNNQGQDMLGLLIYSIPPLVKMFMGGAIFASVLGTLVGATAGYIGGAVDRVLMMISDIMMTLPGLPLLIVLAAVLQPESPFVIGIILTVNAWAGAARGIRSEVLTLRDEGYVEASRLMGLPLSSILRRDVLPNIISLVLIGFVNQARGVIFSSVALYFLGVLPYTNYNWGVIMNNAYSNGALYSWQNVYWLLEPMLAILFLTLGMVLLAQALDRVFNPRIRARNEGESEQTEEPVSGKGGTPSLD